MPLPNEHSCRVRPPGDFQPDSFRRISRGEGQNKLSIVIGRPKGQDTTTAQAYRYPVGTWTEARARSHCEGKEGTFEAAEPKEAAKSRPTASDVHVPGAMKVKPKRKRKPKGEAVDETEAERARKRWRGSILKADEERQLIYGVVLKPRIDENRQPIGEPDTQRDRATADEIEKTAHRFLIKSRMIDRQHEELVPPERAVVVESYIAPVDFELGGRPVVKGSWVQVTYIPDKELWAAVKAKEITGYSIRGWGKRKPYQRPT